MAGLTATVPNQAAAEGKAHASSPQTLRTDGGKNRERKKTKEIQEKNEYHGQHRDNDML